MGKHSELPDFDTLRAMYLEDPDSLDEIRNDLTREIMERAPDTNRRRLEGLQFRINMELERARSPEARFLKLSRMMHQSFSELRDCLNNPGQAVARSRSTRSADVVSMEHHLHKKH